MWPYLKTLSGNTGNNKCFIALMLFGVLLFAFALRLPSLDAAPWLDEVFTLQWTERTYGEVIQGNGSAFMPLVAKATTNLLRSPAVADEVLARLPHLLFGLAGIAALFCFLARRMGLAAAFAGAMFLATLPMHIIYSREARYYAFVFLSGMALIAIARRLLEKRTVGTLSLFVAVVFFGTFNHLSFLFPLAAICAALAGLLLLEPAAPLFRRILRVALLAALCVGAVSAAQLPNVIAGGGKDLLKVTSIFQVDKPSSRINEEDATQGEAPRRYQLTLSQWWGFVVQSFLGAQHKIDLACFLLLAALGAVFLAGKDRKLLFIVLALLACHLPFLFIAAKHAWYERYFVTQSLGLVVLFAAGVQAVIVVFNRSLGRRPLVARTCQAMAFAAIIFLLLALRLAPLKGAMGAQMGGGSENLNQHAALLIERVDYGDIVAVQQGHTGFRPYTPLRYLLSRDRAGINDIAATLRWYCPQSLPKIADQLAFTKESTLWIMTKAEQKLSIEEQTALHQMEAQLQIIDGSLALWAIGKGTVNLLKDGGFEDAAVNRELAPNMILGPTGEPRFGKSTLRVKAVKDAPFNPIWFMACRNNDGETGKEILMRAGERYTLSFEARCEDPGHGGNPRGDLVLSIGNVDMAHVFCTLPVSASWRRYAFPIIPGIHTPGDIPNPLVGVAFQAAEGQCEIYLDNVQLERQEHATPFTAGVRRLGKTTE